MRKLNILLIVFSLIGLLVVFLNRKTYTFIKPTKDYYIYDEQNYLLSSTKYLIYLNSLELFNNTKQIKEIGGTQIVVVALSNTDNSDSTTIFNEWQIGLNDMGILIILYFDNSEVPILTNYSYVAGIRMMGYLPAFNFNSLVNEHLLPYQNEVNIVTLYFEVLRHLYTNTYGYQSFTYNIDNYINIMYDSYYSFLPSSEINNTFTIFDIFDGYSISSIVLTFIFSISVVGNTGWLFSKKGNGGKSIGYKYKR